MAEDGNSSEEGKVANAAAASSSSSGSGIDGDDDDAAAPPPKSVSVPGGGGGKDESRRYGFSPTLIPTLLFKFAIVLCIKFATDVIVFPSLFLYRLARLGKRKIVRGFNNLFGSGDGGINVRVNGDSSSADE